jgi:hypothetical protein
MIIQAILIPLVMILDVSWPEFNRRNPYLPSSHYIGQRLLKAAKLTLSSTVPV